jgi:wobble nucleotide-excising tRNase
VKITRIPRIRNHRIYREFSWPTDLPDFARFNVIYGWNGAGKTTLSNLFRHIQTKLPLNEGEAQFLIDNRIVQHTELASVPLPAIRVFNRDSVDRTIFDLPGKQLSPIYFLGEDSVEKQKHIEEVKSNLEMSQRDSRKWLGKQTSAEREREAFCAAEAKAIKNLLTVAGGGSYNNYDSRLFKQTLNVISGDPAISVLSEEDATQFIAEKDAKVKEKIASVSGNFSDLSALTLETQLLLSRSVVSNAIERLVQNPSLAGWINRGLDFHNQDQDSCVCAFCEQPLLTSRLDSLRAHFNDEFNKFMSDVGAHIQKIENAQKSLDSLRPPEKSLFYEHLLPRYEKAVATLGQQRFSVKLYFDALLKALRAKKEHPFEPLELQSFLSVLNVDSNAGWLFKLLDFIGTGTITIGAMHGTDAVKHINQLVVEHNNHTDNFQQTVAAARTKLEHSHIVSVLPKYQELSAAVIKAKDKVGETNATSKRLQQEITDLEREIRQHQRPAEELNAEMHSYLGRAELKFEVRETGYSITRDGKPALHLSEGERTAIAFMYFLKSLEDAGFNLRTGIVIVDDPVSSLDTNSLYSAFGFLKERTKEAGQLFILTHNFTFFRQVRNWFYKLPGQSKKDIALQPARFYMLTAKTHNNERCASIEPLDSLLHRFESEYHYLFKRVFDEALRGPAISMEANYGIPNIARRVLETFLAFRLPGNPGELHQQLEQIRFDVAKKTRILRFLHTHSHYGQIAEPEHDLSVLAETQPILQDLLALIRDVDPEHYAGMEALMDRLPAPTIAPAVESVAA